MIEIKLAEKQDLPQCAEILRDIYNNNVLSEGWTVESSNAICEFYFKLNPDLFFVAKKWPIKGEKSASTAAILG